MHAAIVTHPDIALARKTLDAFTERLLNVSSLSTLLILKTYSLLMAAAQSSGLHSRGWRRSGGWAILGCTFLINAEGGPFSMRRRGACGKGSHLAPSASSSSTFPFIRHHTKYDMSSVLESEPLFPLFVSVRYGDPSNSNYSCL